MTRATGVVGSAIESVFVVDNNSDPNLQGEYVLVDFGSISGNIYKANLMDVVVAKTQMRS